MINGDIIGPLVHLMGTAEFYVKKEAAYAIANAACGGTHDQIKYTNSSVFVTPLCIYEW